MQGSSVLCGLLSLRQLWVSVREAPGAHSDGCPSPEDIKFQTLHRVFNVNQNTESNFFFKCSLNHRGSAVWKETCSLGFEDQPIWKPTSWNAGKFIFSMVSFSQPPQCSPPPITTQNFFWNSTIWWTSGSSWRYFLPVENDLGYVSPNREVNRTQWSHGLETFILLISRNEKHKDKALGEKKCRKE